MIFFIPGLGHLAVSGLTVRLPVADNWIDEDGSWDAFREQDLLLFIYYYRPPIVYSNKQVRIRKHDKRKTTLCQVGPICLSVFFHCCLVQKLAHLTCKCLVMMLLYNMYKPFLEIHSGLFSELRYKNVMSNGLIFLLLNGILLNFQGCCQKTR